MSKDPQLKKALKKIDTIDMFSKEGWKKVHEQCGNISPESDHSELADGFIDFLLAWYDDNDIDMLSMEDEEMVNDILTYRYTDYLIGD